MNVNKMIEGNKLTLAVVGRLDTNSSPALLKEFTDVSEGVNELVVDLEKVDYGMILDMLIEKANDSFEYDYLANEDDYKNF